MAIIKTKQGTVDPTLWDKLKGWKSLKDDIEKQLIDPGGVDPSITLEHGLQLMSTLRHSGKIQAMTHFTSTSAEVFLTHYKMGSLNMNCSWDVLTRVSGEFKFTVKKFQTSHILAGIIFIPEHRVYVAYCPDLQLQVFTDSKTRCLEMSTTTCITTLLCMAYNSDRDELITGGIGQLLRWTLHGIEKGVPLQPGKKFETSITENDWVRDVKVDENFKRILALCGSKICMVNYETDRQTHFIESRHLGVPCCCSFYKQKEYFVTAGIDGCIKVWNASAIQQVHEFVGHYGRVTSLEIHKTEPLLISSSLDGSLQVWRMDNFQWLKRLDVGEGIYCMKLLNRGVLFCQTLHDVLIYSLNQFYNMFSTVESTVCCLKRISWPGFSSIIITSTEDGSVRLLNPVTGSTITIIFPLPTFHVFSHFAYNRRKNLLFTLTSEEAVLIFDCSSNPCVGVELRESHHDDPILSLTLVTLQSWNGDVDDMLTFVGHANGEVSLLDSTYHILNSAMKIHGSGVTCLETVSGEYRKGNGLVGRLLSAGANNSIRVTDLMKKGNLISFSPRANVHLQDVPLSLSMMGEVVCAVVSPHRVTMIQIDFTSKKPLDMEKSPLRHSINDDHTTVISGLDCCKALELFITAGNDGYVKLWDMENQLIRELHFGDSLQGVCFANLRGDILVGFQRHVCSVSILRYLPVYLLEKIVKCHFEDDTREAPLPFNNKLRLSIEPKQLPTFSTNLEKRKSQIKGWSLTKSGDLQDLINGHWKLLDDLAEKCWSQQRKGVDGQTLDHLSVGGSSESPASHPKIFSPYVAFGLKRFADWMKAKKKDAEEKAQSLSAAAMENLSHPWRSTLEEHVRYTELKLEIKAQKQWKEMPLIQVKEKAQDDMAAEMFEGTVFGLTSRRTIADWRELERLYRKYSIPQDGYIPNSVVRKRFDQEFGLPEVDKPVPVVTRRRYKGKSSRRRRLTPLPFGSRPVSRRSTKTPEAVELRKSLTSPLQGSPKLTKALQDMFKQQPQMADFLQKKPFENQPLQLASLQPFDFSRIPQPEQPKRIVDTEKKTFIEEIKVAGGMIFSRIVKEKWFPTHINFQKGAIISTLLNLLETNDPIRNKNVTRYMVELTKAQTVPQMQQIDFIKALLEQLKNPQLSIKRESIWCLGELGLDHEDIILALIPKLIAEEPMIREETTIAIQKILGINNKDDLLIALEKRGYVTGYVDKIQSEDEIFIKLKQKQEEVLSPVAQGRVMGWLQSSAFTSSATPEEGFIPPGLQESDLPGAGNFQRPLPFARRARKTKDEPIGPSRRRGGKAKTETSEKFDEDMDDDMSGAGRSDRRSSVAGRRGSITKSVRRGSVTSSGRRGSLVSSKRRSSIAQGKEGPLEMDEMDEMDEMEGIAELMASDENLKVSHSKHSGTDSVGSDMDEAEENSSDEEQSKLNSRRGSVLSKRRISQKYPITGSGALETQESFDSSEEESLGELSESESRPLVNIDDSLEESSKNEEWSPDSDEMATNPSLEDSSTYLDESWETPEESQDEESKLSREEHDKVSTQEGRHTTSRSTQGSKGQSSSGTPAATTRTPQSRPGLGGGLGVGQINTSASVGTMLFSDQAGRIEPKRGRGVLLFDQKQLDMLQTAAQASPEKPKPSPDEGLTGSEPSLEEIKKDFLGLAAGSPKSEKDRLREAEERARLLSNKDWSEEKATPEQTAFTEPAEGPSKDSMETVTSKDSEDKSKLSPVKVPLGHLKFEDIKKRNTILSDDSAILSQQSQDLFSENISRQFSVVDGSSTIDSGISTDTSDSSFRGPRAYGALIDHGFPSLSPVKSLADTVEEKELFSENWRDFFKRSTAQERKRLELVKKDFVEGKTKPLAVYLPPISYVKDNVQLCSGNSGFRLLHSVSINEKESSERTRKHRIEPIPAKLGIDTKSESYGSSKFGILKMKWTTNVPHCFGQDFVGGAKQPSSISSRSTSVQSVLPPIDHQRLQGQGLLQRPVARETGSRRVYKWETPLPPPPPPRASCTQFGSDRKHHDQYCRYYSLVKKNMHEYTSALLRSGHSNESVKRSLLEEVRRLHGSNQVTSPVWSSGSQHSMSQKG